MNPNSLLDEIFDPVIDNDTYYDLQCRETVKKLKKEMKERIEAQITKMYDVDNKDQYTMMASRGSVQALRWVAGPSE